MEIHQALAEIASLEFLILAITEMSKMLTGGVERTERERERNWILELALPCQFGIWARAAQY